MAFEDELRNFLETRFLSYDPAIDLSANSPVQLKIISPIIARFGQDPFSTDIPTFIRDRLVQEFPEMAADNGGMAEDIIAKPMQLLLEPFKRQIELVQLSASFNNADIMSEGEVDALGANWFTERDTGDFSSGPVRLFYQQPSAVRCGTDKRFYTGDGRAYFPVQNYSISAQEMAFNRQGSFFFLDVSVRAEEEGDEYNIDRGEIIGVEDMPGVVKVANLSPFVTGDPKETNNEYIDRIENGLTDRSFVTKRGILSRVPSLFDGVRALQIVGAGEPGMDRDILTGTGQGFLHLCGKATVYGDWLWVSEITYRDDGPEDSVTPQPGDTIRFHPSSPAPSATTVVELKIATILGSAGQTYLFLLDGSPYEAGDAITGAFALLKPGVITISGVPGGVATDIEVADNTVHLGGHSDVFVRPSQDISIQTTIQNVTDDNPIVAVTDLIVPSAGQNLVRSTTSNFVTLKVQPGDLVVIETGPGFAGTYQILEVVNSTDLRVSSIFNLAMLSSLRARIVRNIRLDLIAPKIPKLPFTDSPVSDLQTNVGSNELRFASINIQDYTAKVGDTIDILEGPDAGEFTIIGFGPVAGSVYVDRVLSATGANLSYRVYTKQNGITRPLVRIKGIEVLDSTGQATGITVPYGDAVDIRPDCDLEGAGDEKTTYDKQLVILPDLSTEWGGGGLPASSVPLVDVDNTTDARYTLGLAQADGVVRVITHHADNQIETTEINVPPFMWNGRRDKILALTSRTDSSFPSTVPGTHLSSDLAEAKVGDSLTFHDGPNQGKYLIVDHRVLELWGKGDEGHRKVAIIQVDPPLKVDPMRTALNILQERGYGFTSAQLFDLLNFATDWDNPGGFYIAFISALRNCLEDELGIVFDSDEDMKTFFDPLVRSSYTVGPSAKGTFRTYFLEPVSAEFYFGDEPTTFTLASDGSKTFRVDPNLDPAQILPEAVTSTDPALWNRNLGVRTTQDTYAYLTSGAALPLRGIRGGDLLEIYPAINDLPARENMTSSWMCVTQAGSNIVQVIVPLGTANDGGYVGGVDNYEPFVPGQLFYIDSGPDIGTFVITKIIEQDWESDPPVIRLQLDQPLTHTTEGFPVLSTGLVPPSQADFNSGLPAFLQSEELTFPLNLNGKTVEIEVSSLMGLVWDSVAHTFTGADPFNDIAAVIADIVANTVFTDSIDVVEEDGTLLFIGKVANGLQRLRVSSTPDLPSAHADLGLTDGTTSAGVSGAGTLPGTKRLYGSGLNQFQVGDWITLYAAQSAAILTAGDDTAIIGTYRVTAVGSEADVVPFWAPVDDYIEVDRTLNFPSEDSVSVRWLRHAEPETEPANTSGGGKEISEQYVRFRAYAAVPKKIEITAIPWLAAEHPLLDSSEQQIQLANPVVDTAAGEKNYAHKSPYRILRPDVLRISSTEMALQREGALYYVDIPVVGYGPGEEMNVGPADGFVLSGRYKIDGYTLDVDDENFSYSMKEELSLVLPNAVLPVGSTAELDNQFNLSGQNLQITYNNAPIVDDLQTLFDSPQDRVTAASLLVRHFLPGYVMLDATYSGGSDVGSVATEIIRYINNIDPDTAEIRTDLIQDVIKRRGAGTADLPLTVIALFHGTDRRIRGMRSTKSIGIGDTPFFKGIFKQTYFIAGPDTSEETIRPSGEQVFLRRT